MWTLLSGLEPHSKLTILVFKPEFFRQSHLNFTKQPFKNDWSVLCRECEWRIAWSSDDNPHNAAAPYNPVTLKTSRSIPGEKPLSLLWLMLCCWWSDLITRRTSLGLEMLWMRGTSRKPIGWALADNFSLKANPPINSTRLDWVQMTILTKTSPHLKSTDGVQKSKNVF